MMHRFLFWLSISIKIGDKTRLTMKGLSQTGKIFLLIPFSWHCSVYTIMNLVDFLSDLTSSVFYALRSFQVFS